MSTNINLERVERLIQTGEDMLAQHKSHSNQGKDYFVDPQVYTQWVNQVMTSLQSVFGPTHEYPENLRKLRRVSYTESATIEYTLGILKAAHDDLQNNYLDKPQVIDPGKVIERICERFHRVVSQIRARHKDRTTLNVQDEYDVQDLLHALLRLHFDDVRAEEVTPSYAGKSSRMDFLLKQEQIVVEVKMTRVGLDARGVGSQLIEDVARYKSHPDCKTLFCFVYDPDGYIQNPIGIENDISRNENPFPVRVFVRPLA